MKLSLVIPTKNRLGTLKHCLSSALNSTFSDFEILVSNNCSTDETSAYLAGLNDPRLKVVTTPSPLSMRANFEFALDHCTGDWIFYIGDDDGITRFGVDALRYIIRQTGADAVSWKPIPFLWPDTTAASLSSTVLRARNFSTIHTVVDHNNIFDSFVDGTVNNYLEGAKIYHGAISRKVIERLRAKSGGQYFGAMSPDVFVSISNLRFMDKFVKTPCAVSISGKSANSNGWANLKSSGDREKAEKFFEDDKSSEIRDPRSVVDLRVRSVRCHDLDALLLANETLFGNSLKINFEAWIDNIANSLNTASEEEHTESLSKLKLMANTFGVQREAYPEFSVPTHSQDISSPYVKQRLTHLRCKSRKISDIEILAQMADFPAKKLMTEFLPKILWNWQRIARSFKRLA
jgi:hypothetical protein